jgi:hypothetical protein
MIDMMMINKIKVVDAQMSTVVSLIFNFLITFSNPHPRLLHMGTGQFPFRLRILVFKANLAPFFPC